MKPEKTCKELVGFADELFKNQYPMLQLWQTMAENFYPERADFTITRNVGDDFSTGLIDSYPVIARRDLGNAFAAMLRDGKWFDMDVNGGKDHESKKWLQWATDRLMSLINDRASGFARATREGDHDFATFGQAVLSCELNKKADGLIFRCWHLRDCAWWDDETGQVAGVVRKWKPTYRMLVDEFGDKVHKEIISKVKDTPFQLADVRHIVMPASMYEGDEFAQFKYVSIYVDVVNQCIIEKVGINNKVYAIPRFHTIAGHPYAYSPATVAALPNSRMLQAMTFTLLEAAERYARPPLVAQQNVVRGDVDLSSNGITYVDSEYDERFGDAIRPLYQSMGGFPVGMEMKSEVVRVISSAFYLNKIALPETSREMTAYEVQERMKQYRRENLPLFTPMESDYNGQICEMAFDIALNSGFLGSPYDIPTGLQGRDVEFKFRSPLSQSDQEKKAAIFGQMSNMLAQAAQFDEQSIEVVNFEEALRDAITGIEAPEKWLNSIEKLTQMRQMETAATAIQMAESQA